MLPAIESQEHSKRADLIVIAFGVNDVLEHTALRTYAYALKALVGAARSHFSPDAPVLLAAAPPMHKFPALPQPLRAYPAFLPFPAHPLHPRPVRNRHEPQR